MTIDKQTLCIENAFDIENQLYELANNEIECDSFAVTSTNENGTEIEFERPITDLALEAASTINALLKRLESKEKLVADLVAENELARKAVQAFCDVVGDNTEVISEEVGRDGVLVILEAMKATGNMPSTEAFLAEVGAQGVERYAAQLKSEAELADETGWDGAAKFLISESEKVLAFAAQFRQEAAK